MPKHIRYHPAIPADLAKALAYYESQSESLPERFGRTVDQTFDAIESVPSGYPFVFGDLLMRFAKVSKFPYLVLFSFKGDCLDVIGVVHSASDPSSWRERATTEWKR
jgi:hypothetical protein